MNRDLPNLKPGTTYNLTLNDCCIEGEITATFIKFEGDDPEYPDAVFDIGTLSTFWGVRFQETVTLLEDPARATCGCEVGLRNLTTVQDDLYCVHCGHHYPY